MNILFYSPVNFRCRDLESLADKFVHRGDKVYFLTQCGKGPMHHEMQKNGIETYWSFRKKGVVAELFRLVKFCFQKKIDILYSHLEPTNFISVLAQSFVIARVIIFRHHINEAQLYGFEKSFSYKFTYRFARHIIVVSEEGKRYMVNQEKIDEKKIHHINLGYDFVNFGAIDNHRVRQIRSNYKADLLMVFVGRLTHYKRPVLCIDLLLQLRNIGINGRLLVLGKGEDFEHLTSYVASRQLAEFVSFEGFVENTFDYLAAADVLVHPSLLESSCVVVKEAAAVGLPVMVCKNVGDFNNYIRDSHNGFLLDSENFVNQGVETIKKCISDRANFKKIGESLRMEIMNRFSIESTFVEHLKVIHLKSD